MKYVDISDLNGKYVIDVLVSHDKQCIYIHCNGEGYGEEEIYIMRHFQDCCESVELEDIDGDLEVLRNTRVISAECAEKENETPEGLINREWDESYTWTFYKIKTKKGYLTMRWYGASNGYYSESVDIYKLITE